MSWIIKAILARSRLQHDWLFPHMPEHDSSRLRDEYAS